MHFQAHFTGILVGLSAVAALPAWNHTLPALNHTLPRRDACPEGNFCGDCYSAGNCGSQAVTIGIKHDAIGVGDVALDDLGNVIGDQCYTNTATGLAACDASEVDIDTTLEDGTAAKIIITVTAQAFQSWAKNLFVDAVKTAIHASAKLNTVTGNAATTRTVATIPPSFFVALYSDPENTVTIGMKVEVDPEGDGTCGDILGIGGAFVGLIPGADAAAPAFELAELFCST